MAAVAGPLIGGLIGGGAQVGAAELGQAGSPSQNQIFPTFDPFLNPALAGATTDALSMIGRGDINTEPSPLDVIVGRINALPRNNQRKRKALQALQAISEAGSLEDPLGTPFTGEGLTKNQLELRSFARGGDDLQSNKLRGSAALKDMLADLGITETEFRAAIVRDKEFKAKQERLSAELSGLNENVIRNRANTANSANQLLADAAGFATTGQPQSGLQSDLLNRVNRGINDQEEQFLLAANFGGFQPGSGIEGFGRQRTDAPFTAIEQALATAAGLTAGLGGGLEFAQQAAAQQGNLNLGAAGIAAEQAAAANAIRNSTAVNNATTLANGVGAGGAAFGTGLSTGIAAYDPSRRNTTPQPVVTNDLYQPDFSY